MSEVLAPLTVTVTEKKPGSSKSCVTEQLPATARTRADSPSPNLKRQVNGAVPPVNVEVKVTFCSNPGLKEVTVNEVITRGGIEKV